MVHGYIIVVKRSGEDGSKYPLTERELKIGTSAECSVRINTPGVAGEQCALIVTDDKKVKVKNLSKTTPTVVNSRPLIGEAKLKHQDILGIGGRWLRWEYPSTGLGSKKKTLPTPRLLKEPSSASKGANSGSKMSKVRRSLTSAMNTSESQPDKVQTLTASYRVQKSSRKSIPSSGSRKGKSLPGETKSRIPKIGTPAGRRSLKATKLIFSASKKKADILNDLIKETNSPKVITSRKSTPLKVSKSKSPPKRTATPIKHPAGARWSTKTPGLKTIAEGSPEKTSVRKNRTVGKLLSPGFAVKSVVKSPKRTNNLSPRKSLKASSRKSISESPLLMNFSPSEAATAIGQKSVNRRKSSNSTKKTPKVVRKSLKLATPGASKSRDSSQDSDSPRLVFATPETSRKRLSKSISKRSSTKKLGKMILETPSPKVSRKSLRSGSDSTMSPPYSPSVSLTRMSLSSSASSTPQNYRTPIMKNSPSNSLVTLSSNVSSVGSSVAKFSVEKIVILKHKTPTSSKKLTSPETSPRSPGASRTNPLNKSTTKKASRKEGRISNRSSQTPRQTPKCASTKKKTPSFTVGRKSTVKMLRKSVASPGKSPKKQASPQPVTAKRSLAKAAPKRKLNAKPDKSKKKALLVLGKARQNKTAPKLTLERKIVKKAIKVAAKATRRVKPTKETSLSPSSTPGSGKRVSQSRPEKQASPTKRGTPRKGVATPGKEVSPLAGSSASAKLGGASANASPSPPKGGRSSKSSTPSATPRSPVKRGTPNVIPGEPGSEKKGRSSKLTSPAGGTPSPAKRGRLSKTSTPSSTSKSKKKEDDELASSSKSGRPSKATSVTVTPSSAKRGKSSKASTPSSTPRSAVKPATPKAEGATHGKRGRSPAGVSPSPAKRGRSSNTSTLASSKIEAATPGKKGRSSNTTSPASASPSSAKRGRASNIVAPSSLQSPEKPNTSSVRTPKNALGAANRVGIGSPLLLSPGRRGKSPVKKNTPTKLNSPAGNSLVSIVVTPATSSSSSSPHSGGPRRIIDLTSIPLRPVAPKPIGRRSSKRISSKNDIERPDFTELSPSALGLTPLNIEPFKTPKVKGRRSTSLTTPRNKLTSSIIKAHSTTKKNYHKNVSFSKETKETESEGSSIGGYSFASHDITQDRFISSLDPSNAFSSQAGDETFSSFDSSSGAQNWFGTPDLSNMDFEVACESPKAVALRDRIKKNLIINMLSPKTSVARSPRKGAMDSPLLYLNEVAMQEYIGSRISAKKLSPTSDEDSNPNVAFLKKSRVFAQTPNKSTPKRLSRTPGSANDLTDISPQTPLPSSSSRASRNGRISTTVRGMQQLILMGHDYLFKTPESPIEQATPLRVEKLPQKSPLNRLSNFGGLKRLMGTPRPNEKSPKNRLSDLRGVKRLISTPKPAPKSPKNRLSDLRGVKQLLGSPKPKQKSPKNRLSDLKGVKQLLGSPKAKQKTPKNRLSDLRGVKQLLGTSKPKQRSPKNRLSDLKGVKQLLGSPRPNEKSPKNRLSDLRGVKQLLGSPKPKQKSPANTLEDVVGVKQLLRSPKLAVNRLSDFRGVRKLFEFQSSPKNELSNLSGVSHLLSSPKLDNSRGRQAKKAASPKPARGGRLKKYVRVGDVVSSPTADLASNEESSGRKVPTRRVASPATKRGRARSAATSPSKKTVEGPARPAARGRKAATTAARSPISSPPKLRGRRAAPVDSPAVPVSNSRRGAVAESPVVSVSRGRRKAAADLPAVSVSRSRKGAVADSPAVTVPRGRRAVKKVVEPQPVSSPEEAKPVLGKRRGAAVTAAAKSPPKRTRKVAKPEPTPKRGRAKAKLPVTDSEEDVVSSTVDLAKRGRGRSIKTKVAENGPSPKKTRAKSSSSKSSSSGTEPKKPKGRVGKVISPAASKSKSPSPRKTRGQKGTVPTTSPKKFRAARKPKAVRP